MCSQFPWPPDYSRCSLSSVVSVRLAIASLWPCQDPHLHPRYPPETNTSGYTHYWKYLHPGQDTYCVRESHQSDANKSVLI